MALVMLSVIGVSFVASEDSSAANNTGIQTEVYMKAPGGNYEHRAASAYDMYQAVCVVQGQMGFTVTTTPGDDVWKKLDSTGYENPNPDYGTLASVTYNGVTYTDFKVYVYNTEENGSGYAWREALSAIGWYHPFSDYTATYQAEMLKLRHDNDGPGVPQNSGTHYKLSCASVAIVLGTGATAPTASEISDPMLPQNVPRTDQYRYRFDVSSSISGSMNPFVKLVRVGGLTGNYSVGWLTWNTISTPLSICGWGSNAYEALNDSLLLSNLAGQKDYCALHDVYENGVYQYSYNTYYTWMESMLNNGTVKIKNPNGTTTYRYWASYCDNVSPPSYCAYTFGYYSTVTDAPLLCNAFDLIYEESTM